MCFFKDYPFKGFKKKVKDLFLNYNNKRKTSQLIEVLVMY